MRKPPLGMVPYLAGHNHFQNEECPGALLCPLAQWESHTAKYGNPYTRVNELQGDLESLATEFRDLLAYTKTLEERQNVGVV